MDHKSDAMRHFSLLGKVIPPRSASAPLAGYRAQAWSADEVLAEAISDGSGRFLLEWSAEGRHVSPVSVQVSAPWGAAAGETRLSPSELLAPREIRFHAVAEPHVTRPD